MTEYKNPPGWNKLTLSQRAFFEMYLAEHPNPNYKADNTVIGLMQKGRNPSNLELRVFWVGENGYPFEGIAWAVIESFVRGKNQDASASADPQQGSMMHPKGFKSYADRDVGEEHQ